MFKTRSTSPPKSACPGVTDTATELERRLSRDVAVRNRQSEWIERTHQARREQYERYYRPYQDLADILVCQSGNTFKVKNLYFKK